MKHTMRRSRVGKISLTLTALVATGLAVSASAQTAFTPGDLVISRVGNGTETLGSGGNSVFLDEYTTSGTLVQSINITTAAGNPYVNSGTATSEGALTLSANGQYLTIGGYKATPGQATSVISATSTAVNREIARIDLNGNVDKSTALTDAFSSNNIRSATTADGTTFYAAGAIEGIRSAQFGATTSTLVSTTTTNNRVTNIFNGSLYYSTGSGTARGIYSFAGLPPATSGNAATLLVNTGSTSSPYDFVFTDANTVYVADDRTSTTATGLGGLLQFTNSGSGFTLVNTYNLAGATTGTVGLRGLSYDGSGNLYAISTDNRLVSFNTGTITFTMLATAPTNTAFRGVEFIPSAIAPTPEPGGVASLLIGFGALGLLVARRRRAGLNIILT